MSAGSWYWDTPPQTEAANKQLYSCPNCGRSYSWKRSLYRHVHLECGKERRYPCPYCPYRNTRKDNLAVHVNRKHADLILSNGMARGSSEAQGSSEWLS